MRRQPAVVLIALLLATTSAGAQAPASPAIKAPTGLRAATATRAVVALEWAPGDSASSRFVVERKPLGASWTPPPAPKPSPIVTTPVDGPALKDTSIDPFGTYVYRVRAIGPNESQSQPSNEIRVGPPQVGFSQIAVKTPGLRDVDQFARAFVTALDANEDPAVAYLITDPDNNADAADTTVNFIAWDRAAYVWKPPVMIAVTGISDWNRRGGLSLAFDASTNRYGLAHPVGDNQLSVALSDDGVSWLEQVVHTGDVGSVVGGASLAMATGQLYLAYTEPGDDGKRRLIVRTGAQSDAPEKWPSERAPMLPGGWDARGIGLSLALDSSGKPAVAYWVNPSEGYNVQLAFWRPGDAAAKKVGDSADYQSDDNDAQLTFHGTSASIAAYVRRDDQFFNTMHQVWIAQSADNGATWSALAALPNDGGNSLGPPVAVVGSPRGRVVVTAWTDGGNNSGTRCGQPKLIQQSSGKWTICSAESAAGSPTRDAVWPAPMLPSNDKLYVAFKTNAITGARKGGLVLWRER